MDLNQSRAVGGNILGPFQGSLTNVETSGRLQSQIQAIPGQILTFHEPILQTRSNFYGLKWLVQVSQRSPTYLMPSKISFSGVFAVFSQ